jgi:hypothetical protein
MFHVEHSYFSTKKHVISTGVAQFYRAMERREPCISKMFHVEHWGIFPG